MIIGAIFDGLAHCHWTAFLKFLIAFVHMSFSFCCCCMVLAEAMLHFFGSILLTASWCPFCHVLMVSFPPCASIRSTVNCACVPWYKSFPPLTTFASVITRVNSTRCVSSISWPCCAFCRNCLYRVLQSEDALSRPACNLTLICASMYATTALGGRVVPKIFFL